MTRKVAVVLALALSFAASAQREDPSRYERVLLPIYAQTSGAHGSRWQTALYLHNESDTAVDAFPLTPDCLTAFDCFANVRPYPAFEPRQSGLHVSPTIGPFGVAVHGAGPGVFLYVERSGVDELSMQLRVGDTSRRRLAFGARIPVVRESGFFTNTTHITGVPVIADTRTALRIYDREPRGGASVRLRIHELAGHHSNPPVRYVPPRLLVEDTLSFTHDDAGDGCSKGECPSGYGYKPGFIEIADLLARYPALAQNRDPESSVRIELEPITEGLAFWPMASATENETSVVAIYTAR